MPSGVAGIACFAVAVSFAQVARAQDAPPRPPLVVVVLGATFAGSRCSDGGASSVVPMTFGLGSGGLGVHGTW
jgi:hypothetical protein